MLALFPPISAEFSPWRKPLIGSIFISLCFFGSLAALLPIQCSRIFRNKKRNKNSKQDPFLHSISKGMKGHHPSCGKFNLHIFNIKNRVLCAACAGLFIGGVTTIVGSFFYFLTSWIVLQNGILFVILGPAWNGQCGQTAWARTERFGLTHAVAQATRIVWE